jgi:predicted nucleic acid-binding protein
MKLFLDCCCLNRPFDDQSQARVRLEAEAVLKILDSIERNEHQLLGSSYLLVEIKRIPNIQRQQEILFTIRSNALIASASNEILDRAKTLMALGLRQFDALHVASAEASADWLLTTDDRLLKFALRNAKVLTVHVANPLEWSKTHLP